MHRTWTSFGPRTSGSLNTSVVLRISRPAYEQDSRSLSLVILLCQWTFQTAQLIQRASSIRTPFLDKLFLFPHSNIHLLQIGNVDRITTSMSQITIASSAYVPEFPRDEERHLILHGHMGVEQSLDSTVFTRTFPWDYPDFTSAITVGLQHRDALGLSLEKPLSHMQVELPPASTALKAEPTPLSFDYDEDTKQ